MADKNNEWGLSHQPHPLFVGGAAQVQTVSADVPRPPSEAIQAGLDVVGDCDWIEVDADVYPHFVRALVEANRLVNVRVFGVLNFDDGRAWVAAGLVAVVQAARVGQVAVHGRGEVVVVMRCGLSGVGYEMNAAAFLEIVGRGDWVVGGEEGESRKGAETQS